MNQCTALAAWLTLSICATTSAQGADVDPFLWLEEVEGERALAWVKDHNAASKAALTAHPNFAKIEAETRSILEAKDRLASGRRYGDWMYGFWRDAKNPRGLWRRTALASYLGGSPKWQVVLDLDALAKEEGKNWVYKGAALCAPDYRRALLRLSIGGSDAVTVREFDIGSKRFVTEGFVLPEAKSRTAWQDEDTVFVATDFGPGTLTDSGYPRIVKRWRRGTKLSNAETIFEGAKSSVSVSASRLRYGETKLDLVRHGTSFYTSELYLLDGENKRRIAIPASARLQTYFDGQLFVELRKPWNTQGKRFEAGTVLTFPLADVHNGKLADGRASLSVFFEPDASTSLQGLQRTRSYLLVQTMKDVQDHLHRYHRDEDGKWIRQEVGFEGIGTIRTSNVDPEHDEFLVSYSSFLRPRTEFAVDARTLERKVVQQAPQRFDPRGFEAVQSFAASKDGTRIPYFVVLPKDLRRDGKNRTLLYGYGGFRISMRPRYLGATGKTWLERGGVYVVANIRGGGEYGPRWHQAALKAKRPRAYEDFEAVAEDLIAKKITSPKYLGIRGGSNGGLLVGAAFTRRPDLYGAVVCSVPLLDMKRFHKLLAGASWMAEYGNPDVAGDWSFIKTYSPYHRLTKDARYPRVLFTTSTRDDRVHPGHARKMVARMEALGHEVFYYENTEGGHAGAANAKQRAYSNALMMTYLLSELGT